MLRPAGQQHLLGGFDFNLHERGSFARAVASPFANPPRQPAMTNASLFNSQAAAVRIDREPLPQQQAMLRSSERNPPAATFFGNRVVVGLRIEAKHCQFEAILPFGLAVAAARVATGFGENRNDVARERQRRRLSDSLHLDGDFR